MNNEAFKQNLAYLARGYVGSLFHLGVCSNSVSSKLRFCGTAIIDRRSSDVDDARVQRELKRSRCAVGVTLKFHPEASS
jgi:hypothetical protein